MADIDETQAEGSYETKRESDASRRDLHKRWMAEIELASSAEKTWRGEAEKARDVYRSEKEAEGQRFNIWFSNIQTSCPSLYNSTPQPDVRTRYNDEDEVARVAGQAVERLLSYSVDTYPFDETIKACVQDRELPGRGQARVRYVPYTYQGHVYQEVVCEHVQWKHYIFGPCTHPDERPWEAFEHFLTRDQLMKLAPEIGGGIKLDFSISSDGRGKTKPDAAPNVYKRARVYEIWDKQTRKVYWIAPSYDAGPIRTDEDPLGLTQFFATPSPLYAIRTTDNTIPVCPYRQIGPLVEELEEITVRIQALIRVCKWRGIRHPAIPSFERLEEAVDGELVAPIDGGELLGLTQAGLDKFIWLMPIDQLVKVLQQLYVQREQIKQQIFEVSGLADIMRGQSDPNETLGAQEIKANFGTMRLQEAQKDVQRFCRDIFRIKAEVACNLFDSQNLAMMTGLKLPSRQDVQSAKMQLQQMQQMAAQALPPQGGPPGAPSPGGSPMPAPPPELVDMAQTSVTWEDVLETLKSGIMRSYKIDIETDSTVLGDVRQAQQQASTFLDGTAKFMQAMGPAVQSGVMTLDVAVDIYSSIARRFRLGKQAEDALARMSTQAEKKSKEPPQPSPEEQQMKFEMEKMKAEMGMKREEHGLRMKELQFGMQAQQQSAQIKVQGQQADLQAKKEAHQLDIQSEQQKAQMDFAIQQEHARIDARSAESQAALDEYTARRKAAQEDEAAARDSYYGEREAQMSERMAAEKHKRDMQRPAGRPN